MGNSQGTKEAGKCGYRVLGVQPNSPASKVGLVSFFDFIVAADGEHWVSLGGFSLNSSRLAEPRSEKRDTMYMPLEPVIECVRQRTFSRTNVLVLQAALMSEVLKEKLKGARVYDSPMFQAITDSSSMYCATYHRKHCVCRSQGLPSPPREKYSPLIITTIT